MALSRAERAEQAKQKVQSIMLFAPPILILWLNFWHFVSFVDRFYPGENEGIVAALALILGLGMVVYYRKQEPESKPLQIAFYAILGVMWLSIIYGSFESAFRLPLTAVNFFDQDLMQIIGWLIVPLVLPFLIFTGAIVYIKYYDESSSAVSRRSPIGTPGKMMGMRHNRPMGGGILDND